MLELARYVVLNPAAREDGSTPRTRDEAIALAHLSGPHTMAAIATHFDVHYTTEPIGESL